MGQVIYEIKLHKTIAGGKYDLLIGMRDECEFHRNRIVELAIKKQRQMEPGWYKLGEVIVK